MSDAGAGPVTEGAAPSPQALIERAAMLVPHLRENAPKAEQLHHLTDETIQALEEAGFGDLGVIIGADEKRTRLLRMLDEYKIDATLLVAASPAAQVLDHVAGWKRLYADGTAVIHVRTSEIQPSASSAAPVASVKVHARAPPGARLWCPALGHFVSHLGTCPY